MSQKISIGKVIGLVVLMYISTILINTISIFAITLAGLELVTTTPDSMLVMGVYLFFFFFATFSTYFIIVFTTKFVNVHSKDVLAKNIFWIYLVTVVIIGIFTTAWSQLLPELVYFFIPIHTLIFGVFQSSFYNSDIWQSGLIDFNNFNNIIIVLSISSLSLIYYLLHRKFHRG